MTISWWALARPAAWWPTVCRPIPTKRVLLLEAGGQDDWIWFHIPVGYLFLIGNPRSDWMFETEAEPGLNGRKLELSSRQGDRRIVLHQRHDFHARPGRDYDHWRQLGLTGWGWNDVQPVFRQLDRHFLGDSEHHSSDGELAWKRRGCAGTYWTPSPMRPRRWAFPKARRFQYRRQYRHLLFPCQPEARPALVGGARFPQAGAGPVQSQA